MDHVVDWTKPKPCCLNCGAVVAFGMVSECRETARAVPAKLTTMAPSMTDVVADVLGEIARKHAIKDHEDHFMLVQSCAQCGKEHVPAHGCPGYAMPTVEIGVAAHLTLSDWAKRMLKMLDDTVLDDLAALYMRPGAVNRVSTSPVAALHAYYDQVKAEARARHKTYDEGQRAMREMRVMGWKDMASPPNPLCRAMSLPGPLGAVYHSHIGDIIDQFTKLVSEWRSNTATLSSAADKAADPAFRGIVAMGPVVAPFIVRELRSKPDFLFLALGEITKQNPVPPHAVGKVREIVDAWITWADRTQLNVR